MFLKYIVNYLFFGATFYEGDAGGGGGGGDDGDGGDGGDATKPDGLEDSFWDAEAGTVRMEQLIKSHNDTRKSVHDKDETIRERVMSELQSARPESPASYEIKELGIDAPEGYEIKFDNDDPMITMWRDMCFQNNASNDQFMEGIRTWVKNGLDSRVDPDAEQAKLGENGADRVQRLELVMNKHLSDEQSNTLADILTTAGGVEAMEALLLGVGDSRLPDIGDGGDFNRKLTLEELQQMQQDPRYTGRGGIRSNEFIKRVQTGFEQLAKQKAAKTGT